MSTTMIQFADVCTKIGQMTRRAFRARFTTGELVAIDLASADDLQAAPEARQLAAALRVMQRQVSDSSFIDVNDPSLAAGVDQLVAAGFLTPERKTTILKTPITRKERL